MSAREAFEAYVVGKSYDNPETESVDLFSIFEHFSTGKPLSENARYYIEEGLSCLNAPDPKPYVPPLVSLKFSSKLLKKL